MEHFGQPDDGLHGSDEQVRSKTAGVFNKASHTENCFCRMV